MKTIDEDNRTEAYPLCWPAGWPRTRQRKSAAFKRAEWQVNSDRPSMNRLTPHAAVLRLNDELRRVDATRVVLSTNLRVRTTDCGIIAKQANPLDPGAAVYWHGKDGQRLCLAVDRYDTVADNIAALAATLEAFRAVERHGGGRVIERAFVGLKAIPNLDAPRPWREVLGIGEDTDEVIDEDVIQSIYRRLAQTRHPDKGGTDAAMAELNRARDEALREIGG